jgi:hypothetical protein
VWRDTDDGRELFVVESQGDVPYFPPPAGIRLTPWDEWLSLAAAAQYHVALLPLRDEFATAFDETAFWTWFDTVEGMGYGYHVRCHHHHYHHHNDYLNLKYETHH